jgi:allophanate hydrolase subunit 2
MRGGFGGLNGRALAAGDRLAFRLSDAAPASGAACPDRTAPAAALPSFSSELILRVVPGHESGRFSEEGLRRFYGEAYTLSPKSDRMGCRLEGPAIGQRSGADIVSSGVQTGTVQVPGDGQPIVLMADRQTTGGYTRIAQVIRADLPLLGQARPGARVRFLKVSAEEAIEALKRREALLRGMADAPGPGLKRYRVTVDGVAFDLGVEELL